MQTIFHGRHFINLEDFSKEEVDTMLEVSFDLKKKFAMGEPTPYLVNKTMFLMFFEQSTRTRNSMEAGLAQLGGHAGFLDSSSMQVSHGESAKDTAIILSRFGHAIACRYCNWGYGNKYLNEMAKWSTAPVMNLQCDLYHPFQALADLMTMQEKIGKDLKRVKVSIIWAYAESHKKPISVPVSQILLFPRYGMDVVLAHPKGWELPDWVIEQAEANAAKFGGSVTVTDNEEEAYRGANIVIPKNWGSWVTDQTGAAPVGATAVIDDKLKAQKGWKCTEAKMALADKDVVYMHALPADRNNEVEDSVIDGPHSIVYDEAENRIHTAKAVMTLLMGGR
ncbi:aspartate carbamoyltransferase [Acididesulfobacillus acetoxydans]|uniref:Aspartate carbamoyltransferase n=1 Tax=Acididesulfobacillus acetoxydans TaxID=1561005 RepID=A0A8S0Y0B3_9FIRM|nr:ornithine carbamoyltransferase [Acididesulfobacillus acetoxydans]CAA7602987.1 aspartate carbamoyltransferase [Acididesulfobacillus acetoxydans]CEJ05869.1 Ornithine carbamoyltransferase [Acididesulfobacillus acetoxydans]